MTPKQAAREKISSGLVMPLASAYTACLPAPIKKAAGAAFWLHELRKHLLWQELLPTFPVMSLGTAEDWRPRRLVGLAHQAHVRLLKILIPLLDVTVEATDYTV
jgi:hypothetical protein